MKKKMFFNLTLLFCFLTNISFAQKWGDNITKTYENDDGSQYSLSLNLPKNTGSAGAIGSGKDTENNTVGFTYHNLNVIAYNQAGEVIGENFYGSSRVTYIADENDNIVGIKSCWECQIVETFKYTDSGKMLVYGTDGNLNGAYDSLIDYHLTYPFGRNSYNGTTSGYAQYIDHGLNLISGDGNFYDYDPETKRKSVYYADGNKKTYVYSANGDYKLYDKDGHFEGSFMADGTKRRIYNVNEATAATSKGAKNTFILKYR